MATNDITINNVDSSVLSDTEEMEESDGEGGGESDSQEMYFRPQTQQRLRRIEDNEEIVSDGDVFETAMSGSSTEEEAGSSQPNDRRPPRYRRIHFDENSNDSSTLSEGLARSDSDISVVSHIQEVGHEFHSDANSDHSYDRNSRNSNQTWNASESSEDEDNVRDNEGNNRGSEASNSDIEVLDVDVYVDGINFLPLPPLPLPPASPPNFDENIFLPSFRSSQIDAVPSTSKESNDEPSRSSSVRHCDEDEDNGQTCPICFDPWSNVGNHRIVSLKCGHLFGKSCIERWLQKPGSAKCPQCNARACKRDLRVIYAKSVKVEDTTEKERLMMEVERLKRENAKHEKEKLELAMKNSVQISALQKELKMMTESVRIKKSSPRTSSDNRGPEKAFKLGLFQSIDLNIKNGSCRVMAFNEWMNMLVISVPSQVEMFPGFGMKRINTLDFKTENFCHLHSKQIRDFVFNPIKGDLLLSVGFDKVAKVTNASSNSTVVSYNTDSMLWCCCWSSDNQSEFFVGSATGSIYHFDTVGNTEKPIKTYIPKGTGPVVSISYISNNTNSFFRKGLLVTRLNSISFEEFVTGEEECISHDLLIEGNFAHTSFDSASMHFLTTCRPNDRNLHVRHKLYAIKTSFDNPDYRLSVIASEIHSFQGSTTLKVIARSCLTRHNNGHTLLAIFNEESTNSVKVCDVRTAMTIQTIKTGVNIIDILSIKSKDGDCIAMLAEKSIKIYKWIPQF